MFAPITLDQALAAIVADGWRMARVRIEAVRGGVAARRETNPWKVLIWMAALTALGFWCMGVAA